MSVSGFMMVFWGVLIITPIIRQLALANGITDNAGDDPLKIHKQPVALLGGLVIVVAIVIGCMSYGVWNKELIGMLIGGLTVFGVGLWDDLRKISPLLRFLTHVLAGGSVLLAGIRMNFIPVWWMIVPLTIIYVAGTINAANVTDGMDGLCAGVSLISSVGYFFLGLKAGNTFLCTLSAILFMALLGFLPYNFYPAKIFLGDAGSGFLGFIFGTMAVIVTSQPYDITNFMAAILVLGLPILDMALAISRRLLRHKSLFTGDRDHLYDQLLKKGWSQPKVWGVMCGLHAVLVIVALVLVYRK